VYSSPIVAAFRAACDDDVVDDAVIAAARDLLTTLVTTWDGESASAHRGRTVVAEVVPPRGAVLSEARDDEAGTSDGTSVAVRDRALGAWRGP
jgi:hypothetical protein